MKTLFFCILILLTAQLNGQSIELKNTANYTIATMIANETYGYIRHKVVDNEGGEGYILSMSAIYDFDFFRFVVLRFTTQYENIEIVSVFRPIEENSTTFLGIISFNQIKIFLAYCTITNLIYIL